MVKVQSLKRVIIVQFAAILLPLVGLLVLQSALSAYRNAGLDRAHELHKLAVDARDQYTLFVNGAADAVDTQLLSKSALTALTQSSELLGRLGHESVATELLEASAGMAVMATTLTRDRGLASLQALHERINTHREAVAMAYIQYGKQLEAAISQSIADTNRDTNVVGFASALLLTITIWFVYRMVRDWSRPLNFAVSVADTIAAGREVNETEFQGQHDIGNLLQSLSGMYKSLKRYRAEVEASQSGLQEKIQQLSESKSSLAEAQRLARLGNWHWDCTSPTAYWSDEMYRILSASPSECEPALQTYLALMEPRSAENFDSKVKELTRVAGSVSDEQNIRAFDGNQRVVHHHVSSQANASGQVIRLCGTIQDITARRHAEQEIRRLALYDGLTGLPNRRYFLDQLEHTVAQARRSGEQVAAMFLDLDRFKRINDTLGHAAGDALLKEAARRLGQCVRDSDYVAREPNEPTDDESNVARLGGDEFTATLVDLKRPQDAAKVALRILHAMSEPFQIDGNDLVVTASVGIAVYPQDGDSAEVLLKNADTAMYRAKELGKNTYQFFTEDMNSTAFAKLTLESELQKALERDQFVLHYQPKIDIHSGKIAGVEALIRWSHPEWGLMAPGQFIALAEEIGLITVIGSWVMERACCQLKQWRDAGLPPISMAVNLASPSFRQPNLVHQVGALLKCYDVDAKLLQIEATESIMMTDVVTTMKTLTQLRELGVKLSIDDFGTGYSSLSYLRRFPIDQLKIDRSFVIDMVGNADAAAIAGAIVSLGTSLGLELVAEGVETQQQACLLRDMGCRMMQGYYFARPVPADEIAALLSNGTSFVLTPQQPEPEYPAGLTAEYA